MLLDPPFLLVFAAIAVMVTTEILRSIVDRRRRERDGVGGTQDIAMWGTLLGWLCLIAAAIWSAVAWVTD